MRNLFRNLERSGADYLLISGQASVLYGASTFSEDIDLWISPARANLYRFLGALSRSRARVYKLTPPLTRRYLAAGHGFHFILPSSPLPIYLDVMGRPPRVGAFGRARASARVLTTDWGKLPVLAIEDLVLLKRTRRLSDYEVISTLVRVRVDEEERPSRALLGWAVRSSFRAEDRVEWLRQMGNPADLRECRRRIALEIAELQERDVAYWRGRLNELRTLRRSGKLLSEGMAVSELLPALEMSP